MCMFVSSFKPVFRMSYAHISMVNYRCKNKPVAAVVLSSAVREASGCYVANGYEEKSRPCDASIDNSELIQQYMSKSTFGNNTTWTLLPDLPWGRHWFQ